MGWVTGVYDSSRPSERHSLLVLKVRLGHRDHTGNSAPSKLFAKCERSLLEKRCFNQLPF
jgi:hypothetical protein